MPLIMSDRITPADLAAWRRLERYDAVLAADPKLDRAADRAAKVIREFASKPGGGHVGVSWGKDSVVVAHLAVVSEAGLPLVWVRVRGWENPDCPAVRDAFLAAYPDVRYDEIVVDAAAPRRWEPVDTAASARTSSAGFDQAARRYGARHISGVRAQESKTRAIAVSRYGEASASSARPIGRWQTTDVFAYLHRHHLPVHPAYAMSYGGTLDRGHIRVGSLGGIRGTGAGRAEWEQTYYPDVVGRNATDRRLRVLRDDAGEAGEVG